MSKHTQAPSLLFLPPLSHTNKTTKWCYWHSADLVYKKVTYAMMKECCLYLFQDGLSVNF